MHTLIRFCRVLAVTALLCVIPKPVFAAASCWFSQLPSLTFPDYSVFGGTNRSPTFPGTVTCSGNAKGWLSLTPVSSPYRYMGSATYNIYRDSGRTQVWGDTTTGAALFVNPTSNNVPFTVNLYGEMPLQDLPAGTYQSTLVATLTYCNNSGQQCGTSQSTLTVKVTVLAECRGDSFSMDFGTYNPFSATPLTQSATLKIYCTINYAPTSIFLTGGNPHSMAFGTNTLLYDASLGSTSGTSSSSALPIGGGGGFRIDASVRINQDVPVGSYTGTLTATVNY